MGPEFQSITHPMGLIYIGATLKNQGHQVRLHDCAGAPADYVAPARLVQKWNPDIIGLSVIVSELEQTSRIIQEIRRVRPKVTIVLGGPWPTGNPARAVEMMDVDFVLIGESEETFPRLVDAITDNCDPQWIKDNLTGVGIRTDSDRTDSGIDVLFSGPATMPDLDNLPLPAWDLLDHKLYAKTLSMAGVGPRPYMTVVTSRGCPFKCAYCHQTQGKRFRPRSADSVLEEFKILRFEHGFREFEIVDDCFNLDQERMRVILRGIRDHIPGIKLHFPNGVRSDRLTPDDVKLMRQAGTVSACFAIETATPHLQKLIRKNLAIDVASATIRAAVDNGIYSTGFFMLGLPTETWDQAMDTVRFAAKSPLHRAIFMLTTPFAGTELAEMAREILGHPVTPPDKQNLNYFTSSVNISAMSDKQLQDVFRQAYKTFYLNPRRIFQVVFQHPRKSSLPRYALLTAAKIIPGMNRFI